MGFLGFLGFLGRRGVFLGSGYIVLGTPMHAYIHIWVLGSGIWVPGFWVPPCMHTYIPGFWDLGTWVLGSGYLGSGFLGSGIWDLGFGIWVPGFWDLGSGIWVPGLWVPGLWALGSGIWDPSDRVKVGALVPTLTFSIYIYTHLFFRSHFGASKLWARGALLSAP